MQTRLLWRRSATALGLYGSVVLPLLAGVVAARHLGPVRYGVFTLSIAAAGFLQLLLDLTVEEAMIKYGFRYTTSGRWGRLRQLYRRAMLLKTLGAVLAGAGIAIVAPFADSIWNGHGLRNPFLLSALLPITYIPEAPAGAALVLTGRYDVRAGFNLLTGTLRAVGLAIGAQYGVTNAVVGLVAGQIAGSLAVGSAAVRVFRRFPAAPPEALGEDRNEIVSFVIRSSIGSGVASIRSYVTPLLLGMVSVPKQVGYFRAAQAPLTGLTAVTAPARLILVTEQTRDWEQGSFARVFAGLRRYSLGALGLMVVAVPLFYWLMPHLIRLVYGPKYVPGTDAARLVLFAGAIAFVLAWTKSLPVSVGRPGLRIVTESAQTVVLVPLVLLFGWKWDATGAGVAVLVAAGVFAAAWLLALARIRREHAPSEPVAE
jgi:O-antigen/teichoic acid export membrane protein